MKILFWLLLLLACTFFSGCSSTEPQVVSYPENKSQMTLEQTIDYIAETITSNRATSDKYSKASDLNYNNHYNDWDASRDGKKLSFREQSRRELNMPIRDYKGNPVGVKARETYTSWYVDFAKIDYHSIKYLSEHYTKTKLVNLQATSDGLVIDGKSGLDFVQPDGEETHFRVYFSCRPGEKLKWKSDYTTEKDYEISSDSDSGKREGRFSVPLHTEESARRLVNAMKHAVVLCNGGKIPAPAVREPERPKKDPFAE